MKKLLRLLIVALCIMAAPRGVNAQSLVFHLTGGAKNTVALPSTFTVTPNGDKLVIDGSNIHVELSQSDVHGVTFRKNKDNVVVVDVADIPTIVSILTGNYNDDDDPVTPVPGEAPADVEAVDLGLPSGTLWANMNVGAEKPEDYGLHFAWGETVGYGYSSGERKFDWTGYKWCNGSSNTLTKYCTDESFGTADNKTILDLEDDAASIYWGGKWTMPTKEELKELLDNTTSEWTTLNNIYGRKFTSKSNGNSIFIPASGLHRNSYSMGNVTGQGGPNGGGFIWASTIEPSQPYYANRIWFTSNFTELRWDNRSDGFSVRPVIRKSTADKAPAGAEAIDLGLPSGTKWANMNVGAEKPEDGGLYFAWGETVGYGSNTSDGRSFDWASFKWCNGSNKTQTKYCINSSYGAVDNKTVLDLEDDAAHVNWGGQWVMPTYEDMCELINNTTSEWTTQNGVNGRKYMSKTNNNSIFLPAAGGRVDTSFVDWTTNGLYWMSSVSQRDPDDACRLNFYSGGSLTGNDYDRRSGQTVRPVLRK